jgi:hypothetical protein
VCHSMCRLPGSSLWLSGSRALPPGVCRRGALAPGRLMEPDAHPLPPGVQMVGRAGRPQFDTEGVAIIMTHKEASCV